MKRLWTTAWLLGSLLSVAGAYGADARFDLDDFNRIADVAEPALSPDGEFVAYSVTTANTDKDEPQTDLWRVRWDGSERQPFQPGRAQGGN